MSDSSEAPPGGRVAPAGITALLAAAGQGDRAAIGRVFDLVYGELHRLAARERWRAGAPATLSTTALVHEVYLKLAGAEPWSGNDRSHFFAVAARAMRQILVDHARHHGRQKRGDGVRHLSLDEVEIGSATPVEELLALDEALDRLSQVDKELALLVEWRFFAGCTLEEIAGVTGTSERTLKRQWRSARAFLYRELGAPPATPGAAPE